MDIIPAVIKLDDRINQLKFPIICQHCKKQLFKGDLVFYSRSAGFKYWHTDDACSDPKWKAIGTPYDTRKKLAIKHNIEKLTLNDQIKLSLRRFRKELMIPLDKLNLKPEVYQYLIKYHLIEFDEYKGVYLIVPKGFNWDVDKTCVRLPTLDEDIMARDQDVEKATNV